MDERIISNRPLNDERCNDITGYDDLQALALDLHWSWNHGGDKIWEQLDPELWKLTHNPWIVLQTASVEKIQKKLSDPDFRNIVENHLKTNKLKNEGSAWFQQKYPNTPLSCMAYFSMEYMLSEALPIYSGGLGNVAGDQLKAASDLGVPVIAIGLLYQQGYFRQLIDKEGVQQALYPYNDPGQLPITPLRKSNGEWLRLEIKLPGWSIWLRAWQVKVGRARLYLLDSNDAANFPPHRAITGELYGGGPEMRLKQEIILGIGGYRLLDALGIKPEVCHLNECHAAFVVLERACQFMQETGEPFEVALAATRAGNLFTTHTAVSAGFDRYTPSMIEQYIGKYTQEKLGIPLQKLLALGRQNPNDPNEDFNMAYLAIRGSGAINAVSQLHSKVSRRLFAPLFPRWSEDEVPVGYVTNGVHMPSWDSKQADDLWTEACGKARWRGDVECLKVGMSQIPDNKIWQMRNAERQILVEFARARVVRQLIALGVPSKDVEVARHLFDPNILTLGFARRFATYKRPGMLLHDPQRLLRILANKERPVQLILAGKAHPADIPGQDLIKKWMQFIKTPEARPHVIFLNDDDMRLTEQLVQGVDVWINTPRRPWEACGTSGMKVLVNGGLNLSELDGWWAEAYTPEVGWALGDGKEHGDDPAWDAIEANALYDLLEREVVPLFYKRDNNNIPTEWIALIRESMTRLTPHFSSNRTVQEYTEKHYIPAAKAYRERSADKEAFSKQIIDWEHALEEKWPVIQFKSIKVDTKDNRNVFEVQVNLNGLGPEDVQIELFADGHNGNGHEVKKMRCIGSLKEDSSIYVYQASVSALYPSSDYTPRVIPYHAGVAVPLEANEILWQK
jgi:starch phosphorylase